MGNDETGIPSKSEKAPSPAQEQTNVHAYPDWAAIQAYYGPGVGLPPPYFNPAVSAGHAPHPFMWGPQPMMPPYGSPYAAIYPHGGVYAHPSMHVTATTLSIETPSKPSGNKDRDLVKKMRCDGLAVSIGNGNSDNATNGTEDGISESENSGREGSSDGSDRSTKIQGSHTQKKSREQTPGTGQSAAGKEVNIDLQPNKTAARGLNYSFSRSPGITVAINGVAGKPTGGIPLSGMTAGMDLGGSMAGKSKLSSTPVLPAMVAAMPAHDGVSSEHWMQLLAFELQKALDERELKREKRKQSNRESARRSRLRKQAETEELAAKVESLTQENVSLRSEMSRLTEKSEKLRKENSVLMFPSAYIQLGSNANIFWTSICQENLDPKFIPLSEKLKKAENGRAGADSDDMEEAEEAPPPVEIENLLSRVNNSSSISRSMKQELQREVMVGGVLWVLKILSSAAMDGFRTSPNHASLKERTIALVPGDW
ncbi:Common plant regulatory factor [Asimina triloba]